MKVQRDIKKIPSTCCYKGRYDSWKIYVVFKAKGFYMWPRTINQLENLQLKAKGFDYVVCMVHKWDVHTIKLRSLKVCGAYEARIVAIDILEKVEENLVWKEMTL